MLLPSEEANLLGEALRRGRGSGAAEAGPLLPRYDGALPIGTNHNLVRLTSAI